VVGCNAGQCVFQNQPDGAPLAAQKQGDCTSIVCDGTGGTRLEPLPSDTEDDGKVCTLDTCDGTTPLHTAQASVPCYSGPPGTMGVGTCTGGVQQCGPDGNTVGACAGEVVPAEESCLSPLDEDCDGQANESGPGCNCVPGEQQGCYTGPLGTADVGECKSGSRVCDASGLGFGPCAGEAHPSVEDCDAAGKDEDCDGQINESGPSCVCGDGWVSNGEPCDAAGESAACDGDCTPVACGDGVVNVAAGEDCEDGNQNDADTCSSACKAQVVLAVAPGFNHTCALLSGGKVKCWGESSAGQVGLGDSSARGDQPGEMGAQLPFVDLGPGASVTALSAGEYFTCAVLAGGALKCWGFNNNGQLGRGDTLPRGNLPGQMGAALPKIDLGPGVAVTAVSAGRNFACAVLAGGPLKCWGKNYFGQLGLGDGNNRGDDPGEMGAALPTVDLGPGAKVTSVAAGTLHTCAILSGGAVKCWGLGGILGTGDMASHGGAPGTMGAALPFVDLGPSASAVALAAGSGHTCALLTTGKVKCWGDNNQGQLGLGDNGSRGNQPGQMGAQLPIVDLGPSYEAVAITAHLNFSCALLSTGNVKCWGQDDYGALGLGDTGAHGMFSGEMGSNLPSVSLGQQAPSAVAIGSANDHTCAVVGPRLKCWGFNGFGTLGLGDTVSRGDQPNEMGDALPYILLFNNSW
jgi:cysteine-rich repeat protein